MSIQKCRICQCRRLALFTVILVLAAVSAAIGTLVSETFGIPGVIGSATLLLAIAYLVFKRTEVIEGVMSMWSFVLYTVIPAAG